MATQSHTYPAIINGVEAEKDVIVLILAASRMDGETRVPITDGQKDAAMNAAKATLQCVGATVLESSSALLIPALELEEGDKARLTVDCTIESYTPSN